MDPMLAALHGMLQDAISREIPLRAEVIALKAENDALRAELAKQPDPASDAA